MLALIDYEYKPFLSFRRPPEVRYETVLGLSVIRLTAQLRRSGRTAHSPRTAHSLRVSKADALLRKAGADTVCFSEDFPARDEFSIREAQAGALHPGIMLRLCNEWAPGGEAALLTGGSDSLSIALLETLAQKYRYVLTRGLPHKAVLRLRQKTGASVIENPAADKLCEAQLAVFACKGEAARLPDTCTVLSALEEYTENVVHSKAFAKPHLQASGKVPDGFDTQVIIAEALRRGALTPENIVIGACQILTKSSL